jgi:iron-sulfur cluster assembly protein
LSIRLTASAADRVHRYLGQHRNSIGLRLGVKKNGCTGFAYVVAVAEAVTEQDQVFEDGGVRIVVNTADLPMLRGTEVDFVRQGLNENFAFRNPNVKSECGCGESFGI